MIVLKKIIITILALFLLLLLLDAGIDYWISRKLPNILNGKKDAAYSITYKDVDVSVLQGTITATEVVLHTKDNAAAEEKKNGLYAEIKKVKVQGLKLWGLLIDDSIEAENIYITGPKFVVYQKNENALNNAESIRLKIVAPFRKVILVNNIYLEQGDLHILHTSKNTPLLTVANISVELREISITDSILEKKIPFAYKTYAFTCDSLFYRPNAFYHIRTKQIHTTDKGLEVNGFSMLPQYSRKAFTQKIAKEKDLYTLKANAIKIRDMKWGFGATEKFFFHTHSIVVDNAAADIYRGKMPPDDLSKKHLYSKLLREIPFDLKVDTLKVRNSFLEYEEEKSSERGPGVIAFSSFNLTARGITSAFGEKKVPDVKIAIAARFMKVSPIKVQWAFNVLDKSDGFSIKGNITGLPAENMTPFIKPYLNVSAEGSLDQVHFNLFGNDKGIKGDFGIDYDDLKFTVYKKKDPHRKNKLLTSLTRLLVKKDTKEKIKETAVEVERIPEKSFYNLFWRGLEDGLKKILI